MAELIDAEMLILRLKAIRDYYGTSTAKDRAGRGGVVACICAVHDAQRIDAEPIVRCGECVNMRPDGRCTVFADERIRPSVSDFCSYGERREEGGAENETC